MRGAPGATAPGVSAYGSVDAACNGAVGFTGDRACASKGDDGFTQLPAIPVGDSTSRVTQKSHIISLGNFLRTSQNVAIPTIRVHGLKYPQGNYVRNCWDQATHPHGQRRRCGGRRRDQRAWPRCRWVAAGPGRASRSTLPSRQARVWRSRGRPGPTAPGTPVEPQAPRPSDAGGPPPTGTPSSPAQQAAGYAKGAGTEVPAPCRLTQPLPRRGSGRMILSPGDGDASTGTCRQRRPLPGPLRRSGRRSRCGRGPSSAWWPGRRARRNRSSRP